MKNQLLSDLSNKQITSGFFIFVLTVLEFSSEN